MTFTCWEIHLSSWKIVNWNNQILIISQVDSLQSNNDNDDSNNKNNTGKDEVQ